MRNILLFTGAPGVKKHHALEFGLKHFQKNCVPLGQVIGHEVKARDKHRFDDHFVSNEYFDDNNQKFFYWEKEFDGVCRGVLTETIDPFIKPLEFPDKRNITALAIMNLNRAWKMKKMWSANTKILIIDSPIDEIGKEIDSKVAEGKIDKTTQHLYRREVDDVKELIEHGVTQNCEDLYKELERLRLKKSQNSPVNEEYFVDIYDEIIVSNGDNKELENTLTAIMQKLLLTQTVAV